MLLVDIPRFERLVRKLNHGDLPEKEKGEVIEKIGSLMFTPHDWLLTSFIVKDGEFKEFCFKKSLTTAKDPFPFMQLIDSA